MPCRNICDRTRFLRTIFGFAVVLAFVAPTTVFAASVSAGVPTDLIWFSKDPFFDGEEITIFTPLYNSSPHRFGGTVTLYDGDKSIGVKQFSLLPGGTSAVYAFPWKVTSGNHAFSVKISNVEFFSSDQGTVNLPVSPGTASALKRFVEAKQELPKEPATIPKSSNVLAQVEKSINENLPDPLAEKAIPILGGIEQFRENQALRADKMEGEIAATLGEKDPSSADTDSGWKVFEKGIISGEVIHTPWGYTKLFFVLCYKFITNNVYVFYIFLSYILYIIIRTIIRAVS